MLNLWSMKLLAIITLALASAAGAWADPSESGLEHRNSDFDPTRTGQQHPISVPDVGGTLSLLALGIAGLAAWRIKLA
jgi:VPDSG-CTERM motif